MSELTELTLSEMAAGLRAGAFSSRELTQAFLQRIERHEGRLHAFISLSPEKALAAAEDADRRLADMRRRGADDASPLLGIPLAVKDILCLEGMRCTCGSKILETFTPPYSATAVQRLLDAGMAVLGKTNTDEFAMGSSTENSAYGPTHNPWDETRVPGGSSGGSAAAVAARLAPAALGTDTGGSVRQPAAFCGVTGLKPTYGRVSRYGLVAFGSSLDVVGAFANSAADAALLYAAMAGPDPLDATTAPVAVRADLSQVGPEALQGLRIGVPAEYFHPPGAQVSESDSGWAEVEARLNDALGAFERHGARLLPIHLPNTAHALPVYYIVAPAEASANLARFDGIRYGPRLDGDTLTNVFTRTRGQLFGPEVKRRIMLGTYALSTGYYDAYYNQAQKVRTLIRRDFDAAFQQVDIILTPVTPTTAFRFGEYAGDPLAMYRQDIDTLPASLAGIPGISLPCGFDRDGLPVGMQLLAAHFQEERLLQTAHAYQQITAWHTRQPALNT